ncbi:MAG: nuclear transport factor 2 family protein [Candidatus Limnocylindrales bacterium]
MRSLTPGDVDDLLARYKRARERRDVDAAMELYRADADLRPDPFGEHLVGDLAIRAYWNSLAAEQANVEFDSERGWASGSTALAAWHGAWTRRVDAGRVRARGFMTFEVDSDGLVVRERHWTLERTVGTDATFQAEPAPPGPDEPPAAGLDRPARGR